MVWGNNRAATTKQGTQLQVNLLTLGIVLLWIYHPSMSLGSVALSYSITINLPQSQRLLIFLECRLRSIMNRNKAVVETKGKCVCVNFVILAAEYFKCNLIWLKDSMLEQAYKLRLRRIYAWFEIIWLCVCKDHPKHLRNHPAAFG